MKYSFTLVELCIVIATTVLQTVIMYIFDRFGENVKCVSSLSLKWMIIAFK